MATTKAVVMARGLGSRMKKDAAAQLTPDQAVAAASGAKAMMPLGGRPFLDHSLSRLADAGLTQVCLVIGPEHTAVRDYYDSLDLERIEIFYTIQAEPRGTADAVAAAHWFAGDDQVVVINGDNLYPTDALAALARTDGSATIGFTPAGLVANSNIPADRMTAFAALTVDEAGDLVEIVDAVRLLIEECERFAVLPSDDGVLDLSSRGDVAWVASLLTGSEVRL